MISRSIYCFRPLASKSKQRLFLAVQRNALHFACHQFAMLRREKPGQRMPFSSVCVIIQNLNLVRLENLCKGQICSELVKRRGNQDDPAEASFFDQR
jgi:hypothetical protein